MQKDRIRWNEKYKNKETSCSEVSGIVKQFYSSAAKGRALDIAAGTGKNSLFLAEQGFSVDAVDISDIALKRLAGKHPKLYPICADLDAFDIPGNRYSLIINIRFLNRRLFPYIREGLVSGGILIFETYLEGPDQDYCQSSCRDYLLRGNELLHSFLSLKILFYQETKEPSRNGNEFHIASLAAMKC